MASIAIRGVVAQVPAVLLSMDAFVANLRVAVSPSHDAISASEFEPTLLSRHAAGGPRPAVHQGVDQHFRLAPLSILH